MKGLEVVQTQSAADAVHAVPAVGARMTGEQTDEPLQADRSGSDGRRTVQGQSLEAQGLTESGSVALVDLAVLPVAYVAAVRLAGCEHDAAGGIAAVLPVWGLWDCLRQQSNPRVGVQR